MARILPGQIWSDEPKGMTFRIVELDGDTVKTNLLQPAMPNNQRAKDFERAEFERFTMVKGLSQVNRVKAIDYPGAISKWMEKNPIRVGLEEKLGNDGKGKLTQANVAAMCDVSTVTIRHWMDGRTPKPEHESAIASVLGVNVKKFREMWRDWLASKPERID